MTKPGNFRSVLMVMFALVLLIPMNVIAAPSRGGQIYYNDFDGDLAVSPQVTATLGGIMGTESVQGYDGIGSPGNMFGGFFLRNASGGGEPPGEPGLLTTLTLTRLPPHTSIDINFLLAIIDSWDGSASGGPGGCDNCHPDIFTVTVDGVTVFSEAFGFNGPVFDSPPGVLLEEYVPLGFNPDSDDAAYDMSHNPAFNNIPHESKTLTIEWFASGDCWQGGDDESWAIDNLEVVLEKKDAPDKICVVNEPGGNDSPFNRSVAEGVNRASHKLHVEVATLDAASQDDLGPNLETFVTSGDCDLIIGVGFLVGFAIDPIAWEYPDQRFSIIDFGFGGFHDNVAEVQFLTDQAAFLTGYIAAGISETQKVGVFGGMQFEAVTMFMDGYALGVKWFNAENGGSVEVLGWDPDSQSGLFAGTFSDPYAGQALAAALYDEGADTVFPVAGPTGYGALDEAALRKAAGEAVRVIGVDYDWSGTFGDPHRVILTSVVKELGDATFSQIEAIVEGTWQSGIFWVGLEDDLVDIAPFYKLNNQVPGYLKNDLKGIREGIVAGNIPTRPPLP